MAEAQACRARAKPSASVFGDRRPSSASLLAGCKSVGSTASGISHHGSSLSFGRSTSLPFSSLPRSLTADYPLGLPRPLTPGPRVTH
jgi:hypothetical protein